MSNGEKNTSEVLGSLQNRGDQYTKNAVIEKKRLEELEDALRHISVEIAKYRSKAKASAIDVMNLHIMTPNPAYSRADGVDVERQAKLVTNKILNVLEMKLNKLLQRKSEVNNKNKLLKLEIDHMRRLRLQTDDSHTKFDSELKVIKENIEMMLRESNDIVERKEEHLREIERLEKRNKEEQAAFEVEYEAMGRFIKEQNVALENALLKERKEEAHGNTLEKSTASAPPTAPDGVSSSTGLFDGIDTRPGTGAMTLGNTGTYETGEIRGSLTLQAEIEIASKVGSLTKFASSEQTSLANIQAKILSYDSMFEQLKRLTGGNSLREVAATYAAQEEDMFSLYNYIQAVNTEIESATEDKQRIADEIEKYKKQQQADEIHRNKILQELHQRYKATKEATIQCVNQNKIHQDSVDQLSKKVQSIFYKLQCDQMDSNKGTQQGGGAKTKGANTGAGRPENKITLLTGTSVSESNVLDYMAAIEQRAVDIISEYLLTNQVDTGGNKYPTPGPSTPMRHGKVHIDMNEANMFDEPPEDPGQAASYAVNIADGGAAGDPDSKPIDVHAFYEKLKKRKNPNNASSGAVTSSLGQSGGGSNNNNNTPGLRQSFSSSGNNGHK